MASLKRKEVAMAILMRMRPRDRALTKEQFLAQAPPYSIGIDGYVEGPPWRELERKGGPYININHHEGVPRLETRASCAQAHLLVRLGLFKHYYRLDGEPHAIVWMNDCDEDVCWTWFILSRHLQAEPLSNPLLNRAVGLADMMDATGGLWHLSPDLKIQRQLAWIMYPYRAFRASGAIDRRDEDEHVGVVTDVANRMEKYVMGEGGEIRLDTRYKKLGGGPGWAMIEEIGPYGRQGAVANDIRAFVSVRTRSDGLYAYSVGRASDLEPFPVPDILALGSSLERHGGKFGGSTTIGGSDRNIGSDIEPNQFESAINELLRSREA